MFFRFLGRKGSGVRDLYICVVVFSLGEEGVNGIYGCFKDVGRREVKGRVS